MTLRNLWLRCESKTVICGSLSCSCWETPGLRKRSRGRRMDELPSLEVLKGLPCIRNAGANRLGHINT